jgi:mono/diheme cytochrome c family protein
MRARFQRIGVPVLAMVLGVLAGAICAPPAHAQNASNGYRLFQFTSALKGTAQSCAGCHGENPRMPPANAVDGFPARNMCGQDWPAGTVHSLRTFCAVNATTQATAEGIVSSALNSVPQMAQFTGVITAGERSDIAAYLLAVYLQQPVPFARPEFQLSGTTTPIVSVDFGGVSDGATLTRVVHLVNSGTLALQIDAAFSAATSVSGLNATRFTASGTLPVGETAPACAASMTLAPGERCAVAVTFSPDPTIIAGALQTAGLTIRSNGGSGTTQVTLNGSRVAAPAPAISLNPSGTTVAFPVTAAGQSASQTITVTNSGTAVLNFSTLDLTLGGGTAAGEFTRAGTCAVGTPVGANGGSCTLVLGFSPATGATGSKSATLQIASNAGAAITLNLSGTVAGSGTTIGFGSSSHTNSALLRLQSNAVGTPIGGTVTIRNLGNQPLNVTSIAVTTGGSVFAMTNQANCTAAPIAPAANCVVNVTYTPAATSETVGEVTIASNGLFGAGMTPGPHVVRLEGIVVSGNSGTTTATISRTQVGFPSTPVNQTSVAQQVTITNSGASALQASFSGAGGTSSNFVINNGNCANLVAAGSSCTITINFRPRSEGAKNESMNVSYNGGSMSVALSGVGQPANVSEGKGGGGALPGGALLVLGAVLWIARRRRSA